MTARNLLRPAEAAARIGVAEATLRYWRHVGRGPVSFKLGARRVVYDVADVDRWLEEQYAATATTASA